MICKNLWKIDSSMWKVWDTQGLKFYKSDINNIYYFYYKSYTQNIY
jgi:hypothetical protein